MLRRDRHTVPLQGGTEAPGMADWLSVGATCGEADGTALRAMCGHDEHDQAESASKQTERILQVV